MITACSTTASTTPAPDVRTARLSRGRKLLFLIIVFAVIWAAVEAVLWLFLPVPPPYAMSPDHPDVRGCNRYVAAEYPPNKSFTGVANPKITPGIEGKVTVSFDRFGFRSPRLISLDKPAGVTRVFCVGGSTTACLNLDDADTWPEQLQARLSAEWPQAAFDVVNCGMNAENTRGHINVIAQRVLPLHPDVIVLHPGINDWAVSKASDYSPVRMEKSSYRSDRYEYLARKLRWMGVKELLSESQVFRRLVWAKRQMNGNVGDDDDWDIGGRALIRLRRENAQRHVEPMPAELIEPRPELVENLRSILGLCRAHGVQLVLLTQPVLWQNDMPPRLHALCWMGFHGDVVYEPGDLARMMNAYNDAMRRFAREENMPLVDLASELPRDETVFFDDCHYNIAGARRVADLIFARFSAMDLPSTSEPLAGAN